MAWITILLLFVLSATKMIAAKPLATKQSTADIAQEPLVAPRVIISVQDNFVFLAWNAVPGSRVYEIYCSSRGDFAVSALISVQTDTTYSESIEEGTIARYYRVVARLLEDPLDDWDYAIVWNFEQGVELESYLDTEDLDPDGWQLTNDGLEDSNICLELSANTWKRQIFPGRTIHENDVWQIVIRGLTRGTVQAFGIADSANEMWYQFWGTHPVNSESWNASYTGWFADGEWHQLYLPVAEDWHGRFGYYPHVLNLLYANDNDSSTTDGVMRIDEIRSYPWLFAPEMDVEMEWEIESYPHPDSVALLFGTSEDDPLPMFWFFGDGRYSREQNPLHVFAANGSYEVSLRYSEYDLFDWDRERIVLGNGNASEKFTFLFCGDVMMARRYEDPGGVIDLLGVNAIFDSVRSLTSAVDFAMCNLECPLTTATVPHPTKSITFKGRPEYVSALQHAGFDFCGLANNHTLDYLVPGLEETKHVLDSVWILSTGAGENDLAARYPEILNLNGSTAAVLCYCNFDGVNQNEQPYLSATRSRPGFSMWNRSAIEQTIPDATELADFVIAQVHGGVEYETEPDPNAEIIHGWNPEYETFDVLPDTTDRDLRRYAIENGADLVVCHHPHVLQGFETYYGGLIAHSMGNFAFDQRFPETFVSIAVTGELSRARGVQDLVIHPIYIDHYIPRLARGMLARRIVDYVADLSRPMDTYIVRDTSNVLGCFADEPEVQNNGRATATQVTLENRDSLWISAPIPFEGLGYPIELRIPSNLEVRIGREILWFGNIEPEGAEPWLLNSEYERYDSTDVHGGLRCILLTRNVGQISPITTTLEFRAPYLSGADYSLSGWMKTANAQVATLKILNHLGRSTNNPISENLAAFPFDGTTDWLKIWSNFTAPDNALFYNISMSVSGEITEPASARFDDIELIRWEDWQSDDVSVPFPSNISHFQIRSASALDSVEVRYFNRNIPITASYPQIP